MSDTLFFGEYTLLQVSVYVHVSAWIFQFIGHGVFENRSPALLTNLGFALLAPFFATFEVMNFLFGYRNGPKLDRIHELIAQDIKIHHMWDWQALI